jgi:hypothetical protein
VLGASGTFSLSETLSPRLRVNDVLLATDHPQQSIVQIRRGQGYAQFGGFPFVMTSTFHISREEYERRKRAPWPDRGGETIRPTLLAAGGATDAPQGPPPGAAPPNILVAPPEMIPPKAEAVPPPPAGPQAAEQLPPGPPTEGPPTEAPNVDPFASLTRYQEERKRSRTRKKKGDSP